MAVALLLVGHTVYSESLETQIPSMPQRVFLLLIDNKKPLSCAQKHT